MSTKNQKKNQKQSPQKQAQEKKPESTPEKKAEEKKPEPEQEKKVEATPEKKAEEKKPEPEQEKKVEAKPEATPEKAEEKKQEHEKKPEEKYAEPTTEKKPEVPEQKSEIPQEKKDETPQEKKEDKSEAKADIKIEDDDDLPNLEPAEAEGDGTDGTDGDGAPGKGKQTRSEKKNRKAVAKLGMKSFPGVLRIIVKKGKSVLFVVNNPDVFKSPSSENTWVIFGEAKIEDATDEALKQTAEKFAASDDKGATPDLVEAKETKPAETALPPASPAADSGDIAETHIKLVLDQAKGATREQAIKALRDNNKDVVNAIMSLTLDKN